MKTVVVKGALDEPLGLMWGSLRSGSTNDQQLDDRDDDEEEMHF